MNERIVHLYLDVQSCPVTWAYLQDFISKHAAQQYTVDVMPSNGMKRITINHNLRMITIQP